MSACRMRGFSPPLLWGLSASLPGASSAVAAFVLTVGLVIAAYVVPIVLLVALLIYAF